MRKLIKLFYVLLVLVTVNTAAQTTEYKVYPNPVTNQTIYIQSPLIGQMNIEIYSRTGRVVYRNLLYTRRRITRIMIPKLRTGGYIIHIKQKDRVYKKRIFITYNNALK